jgi:flagellar export protein FliJ
MSSSKLDVVLRLTSEEEKQAALTFQALQNDYIRAENDLKQALSYRIEYANMSEGMRPGTFALIQLRAARSFLTQIDTLIEHQRAVLKSKYAAAENRREQWQVLRAKKRSIEALIASRSKSRLLAEEKMEQKRLDDLFVSAGAR